MPTHEYDAEQALQVLINRIDKTAPDLAGRIRVAINEGTVEKIQGDEIVGKKGARLFSKSRPYTDDEAVQVVLNVLRSYFVDLPACIDTAGTEFSFASIGELSDVKLWHQQKDEISISMTDEPKKIEIEFIGETRKVNFDQDELPQLIPLSVKNRAAQEQAFVKLKSLLDMT